MTASEPEQIETFGGPYPRIRDGGVGFALKR
jgi:hypothetical protein